MKKVSMISSRIFQYTFMMIALLMMALSPPVKRKSTVGAGDSMLAGMVMYLSAQKNIKEGVRFGFACGTAATLNEGTQLCNMHDAEKLYKVMRQYE